MGAGRFKRAYNVLRQNGLSGLVRSVRCALAHFILPIKRCNVPRQIHAEIDSIVKQCAELLKFGNKKEYDKEVYSVLKESAPWYQRIELPAYNLSTIHGESWAVFDGASDNMFGGRLSARDAAMLRPLPKWMFIKKRLPLIEGKTVLEIGSNCGFFSFEFARMGAKDVVGVEAVSEYARQANFIKHLLSTDKVSFINADFIFEEGLPESDVVFSSTVLGHMIFPFLGLYKMLKCAKEFVVFDIDVLPASNPSFDAICTLQVSNRDKYHFFNFSSAMISGFLRRCGVDEKRISTHFYSDRCLYIIDVRSLNIGPVLKSGNDPLWSNLNE